MSICGYFAPETLCGLTTHLLDSADPLGGDSHGLQGEYSQIGFGFLMGSITQYVYSIHLIGRIHWQQRDYNLIYFQ